MFIGATTEIESTARLIKQLRVGDEDAFGKIYDNHASLVYSLICRMVRDSAVAEDLLQEVFFKLWRCTDRLDDNVTSLRPWLLTVARRRVLDYLRSGCNQQSVKSQRLESPEVAKHFSVKGYDAVFEEKVRYLQNALASLDSRHREVLEMAYFEGLSQTEIAKVLHQPLGTVKSWVRRGLGALKESMLSQRVAYQQTDRKKLVSGVMHLPAR